jgi:hypothetical protein
MALEIAAALTSCGLAPTTVTIFIEISFNVMQYSNVIQDKLGQALHL